MVYGSGMGCGREDTSLIYGSLALKSNQGFAATQGFNVIGITRADIYQDSVYRAEDRSQPFNVQLPIVEDYLVTQIELARRKTAGWWKFGVVLGLGIGAPILIALTALAIWLILRKTMMKEPEEAPEEGPREAPMKPLPVAHP
ncbi:hypothetical protein F5Y09DRAFT_341343 [Xylaria sp. FL1042]|nr:hypothetical protein F5Y09DRAFT_341343 [Xylaria sp. FL1042]